MLRTTHVSDTMLFVLFSMPNENDEQKKIIIHNKRQYVRRFFYLVFLFRVHAKSKRHMTVHTAAMAPAAVLRSKHLPQTILV